MNSILNAIIGKKLTPEEQVKRWKTLIREQDRDLSKTIRSIEGEEVKTKRLVMSAAKRNDLVSARMLAKQIAAARRQKSRLVLSKAHLNSLLLQIQQQTSMMKVTGMLGKSAEMMKLMNNMVRVPEVAATMQTLSAEMMKAGILDEMMGEALDDHLNEDGIEEEAEAEVNQVLAEITHGMLGEAPLAGQHKLEVEEEQEKEEAAMQARLAVLKQI